MGGAPHGTNGLSGGPLGPGVALHGDVDDSSGMRPRAPGALLYDSQFSSVQMHISEAAVGGTPTARNMLLDESVIQITRPLNSETHSWCPACGAFPLHVFHPSGFTLHFSSITRNCQPLPGSAAICARQRAQVLRVLLLVIPAQFPAYTAKVRPPGPPTRRQQRVTGQQRRHWPAAPHGPAAAPDRPPRR